jgi:hypothetical protein
LCCNSYKDRKYVWGVFKINNDSIIYERWLPTEIRYKSYTYKGVIINDTTFNITERFRLVNGLKDEFELRDETYHFRQFSPKPDSANNFIK